MGPERLGTLDFLTMHLEPISGSRIRLPEKVQVNVRQENDMKIKASSWNRFTWIGSICAIPIVLFLMFRPDWGTLTSTLTVLSFVYLGFIGGTGVFVAILMRIGIIVFVYSSADKRKMFYRISRDCAAMEESIWGSTFSDKYYDTYLKNDKGNCRTKP